MEMHQPRRISEEVFKNLLSLVERKNIREGSLISSIFDEKLDKEILDRVANNCYLPTLDVIVEEEMKIALSLSGILLEFLGRYKPKVVNALKRASSKGLIEFLCEPYHHSLAMFAGEYVFCRELEDSCRIIKKIFGVEPKIAFNTEGLYADSLANLLEDLGFSAIITEGVERILGWRNTTFLYSAPKTNLKFLLRHYWLSDDIGFRFSDKFWREYPLTAEKYTTWVKNLSGDFVVIGFDMETFGEHFSKETGILNFLKWLPRELEKKGVELLHPSEVLEYFEPVDELSFKDVVSWADREKDESAWLGNEMQKISFEDLMKARQVFEENRCDKLWRMLLMSDHFYYMSIKPGPAGMVHGYFNPYKSPFKAFKYFIEALRGILFFFAYKKPV